MEWENHASVSLCWFLCVCSVSMRAVGRKWMVVWLGFNNWYSCSVFSCSPTFAWLFYLFLSFASLRGQAPDATWTSATVTITTTAANTDSCGISWVESSCGQSREATATATTSHANSVSLKEQQCFHCQPSWSSVVYLFDKSSFVSLFSLDNDDHSDVYECCDYPVYMKSFIHSFLYPFRQLRLFARWWDLLIACR